MKGSLTIVGTGISAGHLTVETRSWIASAQKVLYCVVDAATEHLILKLNPSAESLSVFYGEGKPRKETYLQMVERTLECVRLGQEVCAAYYGHPGIFVAPSHKSIDLARKEGYPARMLPAVSSLDCLFCDLGIDPATGCQILEATDVLLRKRAIDVTCHVIIWQIGATGDLSFSFKGPDRRNVPLLAEYLLEHYPSEHEVTVYEAAQYPVCEPTILKTRLKEFRNQRLNGISTLYIPPKVRPPIKIAMLKNLGLESVLKGKKLVSLESKMSNF